MGLCQDFKSFSIIQLYIINWKFLGAVSKSIMYSKCYEKQYLLELPMYFLNIVGIQKSLYIGLF